MKKIILLLPILFFFLDTLFAQNLLSPEWKISFGNRGLYISAKLMGTLLK